MKTGVTATWVLTKSDFAYFKKEFMKAAALLGVTEYEVFFFHEKLDGALANCAGSVDGKAASIRLARVWEDTKPTRKALREVAQHEALELLLWEAAETTRERYDVSHARVTAVFHTIVRRLEKACFGQGRGE